MSGNLFRFQFTDDSASIYEIINDELLIAIRVAIVYSDCGSVIGSFRKTADCLTIRREVIFKVLQEIDEDFLACPFFDRDLYRVRVSAVYQ